MAENFAELCKRPGGLKKAVFVALSKEFMYCEEFADVFTRAILTPCNLLLTGPGGYGKSEMTKAAFRALEVPFFVKGLTPETTFAEILGGLDAVELLRTGAFKYRTSASFMVHQYALFEEMLDASDLALSGLKDVLFEGRLRNGEQQVDLDTKTLIGATNKSPEAFAQDDDSLLAFLDRFSLGLTVLWPSHNMQDYQRFFRMKIALPKFAVRLKEESDTSVTHLIDVMSHVLAELSEPGREVSPRVALQCFEQVLLARQVHGHRLVWDTDFESLYGVLGLNVGLGSRDPILSAIGGGIGRYGYMLCCNQVNDRIARLERRYQKVGDDGDSHATCFTEHGNIEKFLKSMVERFPKHVRDIQSLVRRLADVAKEGKKS